MAVIWANSCGNSKSRRLQAEAVPAESEHKKLQKKLEALSIAYCLIGSKHTLNISYPKDFSTILAVLWADSCGNSTRRRLQAEAVPAESEHKKTANKMLRLWQ
ncbi:hypothetical protein N039_02235 [Staphylococcus sp. EGD-HP3]|nr:hypothetical protein N039_02235 [Staphylococcus sp. EGD-HP3]